MLRRPHADRRSALRRLHPVVGSETLPPRRDGAGHFYGPPGCGDRLLGSSRSGSAAEGSPRLYQYAIVPPARSSRFSLSRSPAFAGRRGDLTDRTDPGQSRVHLRPRSTHVANTSAEGVITGRRMAEADDSELVTFVNAERHRTHHLR